MKHSFRSIHPFVAFVYYAAAVTAIMLYQHPFFLSTSLLLLIIFNVQLDRGKTLRKWLLPALLLAGLFLIITPLFNHRGNHILLYFLNNPITVESLVIGLMNALTLLSILFLFITFNFIIDSDRFLFLFSKWFPQWSLLIMLSLRFVPLLRRRLRDISAVQKARGLSISEGPFKQRIKNGLLIVQILLTWSLEEGIQTADSMAARGYGLQVRSRYIPFSFRFNDCVWLIGILSAAGGIIFGWWLGDGVLSLLPILEPILLYGRDWNFFMIFGLLLAFPLIIEAKEAASWRYWKRKI